MIIINHVIDILNKEFGYSISKSYYSNIQEWEHWWRGYYEPFHSYIESSGTRPIKRELYSLKMAKKVCEDWASILLNEKTKISVDDKQSQEYLVGNDGSGGLLRGINFWTLGNRLVEKAFYSGTGAIIIKINNMLVAKDQTISANPGAEIQFEYVCASGIIPISTENGDITEAAFVSHKTLKGKEYAYVQIITRTDTGYQIENRYYLVEESSLKPEKLPPGVLPKVFFNTQIPPFVIITPNIENCISNSQGLGSSVYANSIDNLKGVDLAFNNFNRDFKLGGKKVFLNSSLVHTDENGNTITPDDVAQQLFVSTDGELAENASNQIQEYNPSLRVAENQNGIQAQLDYLSFKCGLGTKHYQFNAGSIVTATQYMGDKQELIQNASKHYIILENALIRLMRFVLWAAKNLCGHAVNPDALVAVQFDDSYIIDKESERLRDQQEVRDGLMQKWEYRVKWYDESEKEAKSRLSTDDPAKNSDDELMGFGADNA